MGPRQIIRRLRQRFGQQQSLRFSTLVLAAGGMVSKVLGLARQWLMALLFGTSAATDSWLMASIIPVLLFEIIGGSFNIVMIPLLSGGVTVEEGNESTDVFLNEAYSWILVISALMIVLLEIFSPQLVHLIAPGFRHRRYHLTVFLLRLMLPAGPFLVLGNFMNGILQSKKYFIAPALTPVIINVVRVATIIGLGMIMGITGVAIGFTLAQMTQLAYLIPALKRHHIALKLSLTWRHPWTRQYLKLATPTFLAHSVQIAGTIVDRIFASTLAVGRIAGLNFAEVISQLPIGLAITPVIAPIYTQLAELFNRAGNSAAYRDLVRQSVQVTLLVVSPFFLAFVLLRVPIVEILYQHGRFNEASTALTSRLLLYWTLGIPGTAFGMLFSRIVLSQRATRTSSVASIISIIFNVFGDFLLVRPFGSDGLALATSIAAYVRAVVLSIWLMRHHLNPFEGQTRFLFSWVGALMGFGLFNQLAIIGIHYSHLGEWYLLLPVIAATLFIATALYIFVLVRLGVWPVTPSLLSRFVKRARSVKP
ncbi:murein biosynthesis integral membrane protein MurJ [Sulfobacillus thermotolerans]|uniref:Lipid II flippase n=1 Tax=Sulfobacillus thermotolerans TaxID=338644 RepID=A0ABN5H232_9FIRM|nr:murein biosynthesis integral membrane protein MurJ [Sulfobacillus thermotolerans]